MLTRYSRVCRTFGRAWSPSCWRHAAASAQSGCSSFYADRHGHAWVKHLNRRPIDPGKGKRQLALGGRLDARYQITIPASLSSNMEAGEQ
jgi:hypothetical protein